MAADRYVVLGLARARAAWFGDVARWATSAALPVDFVKVRVGSRSCGPGCARAGRSRRCWSTAASPRSTATWSSSRRRTGCAVLAVDDGRSAGRGASLGVARGAAGGASGATSCSTPCGRVARPIARGRRARSLPTQPRGRAAGRRGGAGSSPSPARAARAGRPWPWRWPPAWRPIRATGGLVVLADLALHAQQALLHDAGDVVPGLLELVEAHRSRLPRPTRCGAVLHGRPTGGYDLLLGLRRHRDWTALRPRALDAALDGLRRCLPAGRRRRRRRRRGRGRVRLARRRGAQPAGPHRSREADLVVAVGLPGVAGLHAQLRVDPRPARAGCRRRSGSCRSSTGRRAARGAGRGRHARSLGLLAGDDPGRRAGVDAGVRARAAPARRARPRRRRPAGAAGQAARPARARPARPGRPAATAARAVRRPAPSPCRSCPGSLGQLGRRRGGGVSTATSESAVAAGRDRAGRCRSGPRTSRSRCRRRRARPSCAR